MIKKEDLFKANEVGYIVDLIGSGLIGEPKKVELAALSLARSLQKKYPEISKNINQAISSFALNAGASIRSSGASPLPVDHTSQLEMVTLYKPNLEQNHEPILTSSIKEKIDNFLNERNKIDLLLNKNIRPSSSMLLVGPPGTGKTMLAKYIASKLNKNLVVLDLSTSMSSLMGKTGANLKRVLQYAKHNASVLLFDEFDAIAKKRDDNTDLGEIKRIVNVLLMELEDWPVSSVFIATSNHPELLDKAIWRRFDHHLSLPLPKKEERLEILKNELGSFLKDSKTDQSILDPISGLFQDKSPADLCKYANNVKRRSVLNNEATSISLFKEIEGFSEDKKMRAEFCKIAKEALGNKITIRQLAEITGLSAAGVQHHLKKS
ncbi:MAG: ATP-binding protein [Flavobacteriales bacterium]|nr:ATP-binding protein [Flavobacteriales bacterium]MCW8912897.1 ATP-binding protein [Flavobacteriales bacterium]MCW8937246.1 ATP-binding protein [Flavobacteriales bacterium]MCW8940099.1 ATP-binding protein [Flavobacteriales bacterium]MCW8967793.1 ATP-binding protein [Flavobacteriales bacterium]